MNRVLPAIFVISPIAVLLAAAEEPSADELNFFETKIRPVLVERCYKCHSAEALRQNKLKGELQLDTREAVLKGGETGPGIVPGDVKASLLLQAIRHEKSLEMPPKSKLSKKVIADFEKWVSIGAPDPRDGKAGIAKERIDIEAGRKFWSFKTLFCEVKWVSSPFLCL